MRRIALLIFILTLLALSGCPIRTYGFYRATSPEPVVVGYKCVENQVRAIPGISNLEYEISDGGRPLTWSGVKPADTVHRYSFEFRGEKMDFWLTERWDGKVTYDGGARTPDKAEAPDLIGLSEPLFADIESGIQRCGYENLDEVVYGDEF